MMSELVQLNQAFKSIVFTESNHSYVDTGTGQDLISVTKLISTFKEPFQENFWATYKAFERSGYGVRYQGSTEYFLVEGRRFNPTFDSTVECNLVVTPEQIKQEYKIGGLIGRERGTLLHNYLENKWLRKDINLRLPEFVMNLPTKDAIEFVRSVDTLKILANEFYNSMCETHCPVVQEFVIGDSTLDLAGTFDLLLLNTENGELELWDYKTDKKFETSSKYKLKVFDLDACELNKYSLQLSMYKYMIEKNTKLKIPKCFVSHFDFKNRQNNVYETIDYTPLIHEYFITNADD